MKAKFYLYASIMGGLSACFIVQKTAAQCNCSPGVPATATVYTTSFGPTTVYPPIQFPKFDPTTAELRCMTFSAIMQGESTSSATATAGADKYKFRLTLTPRFQAIGGFDMDSTIDENYGPDSLASQHWIDSVSLIRSTTVVNSKTYGPTPILINSVFSQSVNGPDAYYTTNLSTPVVFTFSISGGLVTTSGGANYTATVSTLASGDFTLTYYSCPLSPLASGIKSFTTNLKNNYVLVKWFAQNQTANTTYELQVSTDGKNFKTVYVQPVQLANGSSTNYQYSYSTDGISADNLYFRIKQTEASGKISYSAINNVSLTGGNQQATVAVYPNPVVNKFSLQFDRPVSGDYSISLVSATGQKVFNKILQLNNTNLASVDMGSAPPSGLYYLRAIDQRTGTVYTNKLFVK